MMDLKLAQEQDSKTYIFGEIDKLEDNAGIDEVHFGYYRALANRFHQSIYYKIDGDDVTVWRVLDQRFNPRRIESALTSPNDDEQAMFSHCQHSCQDLTNQQLATFAH